MINGKRRREIDKIAGPTDVSRDLTTLRSNSGALLRTPTTSEINLKMFENFERYSLLVVPELFLLDANWPNRNKTNYKCEFH